MAVSLRQAAILLVCFPAIFLATAQGKEPVDYADPLVNSAHSRWIFFSSACRPFAMVNLSPDTNPDADAASNSSYCYHKGSLCGLSHVHAWQLGGVSVMPVAGEVDPAAGPEAFRSPFRHDDEVCQPGYHAVTLDRYRIRVELTSTRGSASTATAFRPMTVAAWQSTSPREPSACPCPTPCCGKPAMRRWKAIR